MLAGPVGMTGCDGRHHHSVYTQVQAPTYYIHRVMITQTNPTQYVLTDEPDFVTSAQLLGSIGPAFGKCWNGCHY